MMYIVLLLLFVVVVAIAFLLGKQQEKNRQQEQDKQLASKYEEINVNTTDVAQPFNKLRDKKPDVSGVSSTIGEGD